MRGCWGLELAGVGARWPCPLLCLLRMSLEREYVGRSRLAGLLAGRNVAKTGKHQLNQAQATSRKARMSLEREYVGARRAPQKSTKP